MGKNKKKQNSTQKESDVKSVESNSSKTEIKQTTDKNDQKSQKEEKPEQTIATERELTIGEKKILRQQEKLRKEEEELKALNAKAKENEKKEQKNAKKNNKQSTQQNKLRRPHEDQKTKVAEKKPKEENKIPEEKVTSHYQPPPQKPIPEDEDWANHGNTSTNPTNSMTDDRKVYQDDSFGERNKNDRKYTGNKGHNDSYQGNSRPGSSRRSPIRHSDNSDRNVNRTQEKKDRANDRENDDRYGHSQSYKDDNKSYSKGNSSWRNNKGEDNSSSSHKGYTSTGSYPGNKNWGSYNTSGKNYGNHDGEFKKFLNQSREDINYGKLQEKTGDLFMAPVEYSLAHCVAEDMSMGAGIAVGFRKKFGNIGKLLNQGARTGGLAYLKDGDRYIYYLVTKERSQGKPTLYTLWLSLQKMKQHCEENEVKKLALPQIGCGLDRLNWPEVRKMLEYVFQDIDIEIVVYSLQPSDMEEPPQKAKKCYVTHANMTLPDIEHGTGLIYFGTENGHISKEMEILGNKYPSFTNTYKKEKKVVGQVLRTEDKNEILYGLINKKKPDDHFDFEILETCLKSLRSLVRKDDYRYVGFQAFTEKDELIIADKILSLMQYILQDVEIWVCWPEEIAYLNPNSNNSRYK